MSSPLTKINHSNVCSQCWWFRLYIILYKLPTVIRKKQQHIFFEVDLHWQPGHAINFHCNNVKAGKLFEPVCLKAGDEICWRPEHLLLAAFSGNYLETLRAFSQKKGLAISRFSSSILAQLEITPKSSHLVDINFYPEIEMENTAQTDTCKDVIDAVQHECLIERILLIPVIHHTVLNKKL